jgi:ABC-2 type transport system permease protein
MNRTATLRSESSPRRWDGSLGWAILKARVRIRRSQFRVAARRHPGRIAMQVSLILPAFLLLGFLLFVAIGDVLTIARNDAEANAVLASLLTLSAIAAFIGSSTTALQSLYLSNDIAFLMTLPVPLRVLFAGKFVDSVTGSLPGAFLGAVTLAAFGAGRADSLLYLPFAVLAAAMVILMATAGAVLVVALVTRSIPPKRARVYLFGISFAIVVAATAAFQAIGATPRPGDNDSRSLVAIGESMRWLPTGWIARVTAQAAEGDGSQAIAEAVWPSIVLGTVVVAAYQVFARSFAKGVAAAGATPAPRRQSTLVRRLEPLAALLPHDIGALVVKEWLTGFRDLKRLSGVIWPLGVVSVYGFASARQQADGDGPYQFWLGNASLTLVPWALSLGFSIYAFGSEGRSIHLLRLLPVSPRRLFVGKAVAAIVPILLFSEIIALVVGVATGGGIGAMAGMAVLVAWGSIGFVIIDTAAAAYAPNFEAEHIQRSTELVGRGLGIVAGTAFGLASAVAAGRIVFFVEGPPEALAGPLAWNVAGVQPLGWPLVVVAIVAALGVLYAVTTIANASIADLIRNGP